MPFLRAFAVVIHITPIIFVFRVRIDTHAIVFHHYMCVWKQYTRTSIGQVSETELLNFRFYFLLYTSSSSSSRSFYPFGMLQIIIYLYVYIHIVIVIFRDDPQNSHNFYQICTILFISKRYRRRVLRVIHAFSINAPTKYTEFLIINSIYFYYFYKLIIMYYFVRSFSIIIFLVLNGQNSTSNRIQNTPAP